MQDPVTKTDCERKCRKMAKFKVEMTVEIYSPKDWNFRVKAAVKFEVETMIAADSPRDWKFRVETTIKCKIETTDQKLKKDFLICF